MICLTALTDGNFGTDFRQLPPRDVPTGLSGVAIGVLATLRAQPAVEMETVMATVYVVTAEATRANGLTTSPARSGGGRRLPDDKVVRGELARSTQGGGDGPVWEKVEELFWTRLTRSGPIWRECRGNSFHSFVRRMEKNGRGNSTLPPWCVMIASMDRRALERLGHHVVSRRVALGYRNRTDLADSLQFTVRTLADIEHGVRKASPGTYAMLENKLAWAPGSIDTILAGGEPKETVVELRRPTPHPLSHTSTDALSRASTEELLLELRRRIIAPRHRRHETWDDWDGGLDPGGRWPEQG